MSGLGHYLEDEGVPTVQVSLIREHTELMRAPRGLWVPFMLGRPLGVPHDPAFQRRVLLSALQLLERPSGPVLEDFPEEAPEIEVEDEGWVCPIAFQKAEDVSLGERLRREIQQYRTWYDLGVEKRGRTTVGASALDIDAAAAFLVAHAEGEGPESPDPEISTPRMIRLVVDDLKTFLFEAAEAQPGSATPNQLDEWFWTATTAGEAIQVLWRKIRDDKTPDVIRVARTIIPREWTPAG